MREISVSSAAQGFAGPREVKESTLPSATSRMRLSRLIPTTNALPARHARSTSLGMVALLRVPAALVCRPRGRGASLLPLPVHAAILLGFKRLPRMQVRPAHVPAPPSTPADRY
eukprot:6139535-Prymnesium_polylepis.1